MPATVATESKGITPMRNVLEGIFPPDLGSDNAQQIAQENLKRIQSKSSSPSAPPVDSKLKAPEVSPQLKALETFANPKTPEPASPAEPKAPEPIVPEVIKEPAQAKQVEDAPIPGFEDLEAALDLKPKSEVKEDKAPKVEDVKTGEIAGDEELDAPVEIPKTAKQVQEAIVKLSKLNREKAKKIKELEARGSIDTAALAVEPLQARIKALEAERGQLLNVSASAKLELHPDVQRQYIQPRAMAENFITEIAKSNDGVSSRDLFTATTEGDRGKRHAAVRAACADLHPSDALQVEQAVDAIHELNGGLEKIKGNAANIMANMEKQQQEANMAKQAVFRAEALKQHDETFRDILSDPVIARFAEKNPEFKKQIEAVRDTAKNADSDYTWANDHKVRTKMIQNGLAFPVVVKQYQNQVRELLTHIKTLQQKNLGLKAPALSTQPRSQYTPPSTDKPQSLSDMVKGTFAALK